MSRVERQEQDEKCKEEEAAAKAAQAEADRIVQEQAKCVIERAQLEEEKLVVQKRLEHKRKLQEMAEEKEAQEGPVKVSATSKQQWKEHLGLKARKCKWETEVEEYQERMMKTKIRITNLTRTRNRNLLLKIHTWMMRKCLK